MPKRNQYDLTPGELESRGIRPDDYAEAGEVCMEFMRESNIRGPDVADMCTRILDHQKNNESFSDTMNRLKLL